MRPSRELALRGVRGSFPSGMVEVQETECLRFELTCPYWDLEISTLYRDGERAPLLIEYPRGPRRCSRAAKSRRVRQKIARLVQKSEEVKNTRIRSPETRVLSTPAVSSPETACLLHK